MLAVAIFLRSKAPPEAARLLPESDGIVYVDLRPVRTFFRKEWKPAPHDPEYQQFIDATGIDWERDLDQAAVALHRMPDPNGPNGQVAYSMVLVGKLTGPKLRAWLASHATAQDSYGGKTIYSIPSEGRTVRVAQIGYDMVAVSNAPTTEQIHSIVDRHRTAALPFSGSTLLTHHYHEVPLLSLAWGVGQIGLPFNESGAIQVFGLQLPIQSDSTIIASVAPELPLAGALKVRVEEIAPSEDAAASQSAAISTLVDLAKGATAPLNDNPANRGLKDLLKTAEISQSHNRVVIKAALPPSFFASLAAGKNISQEQTTSSEEPPSQH
ncbi:hypothetical protein [Occallatibacter riparius]|uniref:Uncharacterized protein n=1 Tax=Occallatibacter riparius TaxID=1002689 RepID=A0A9J7BVW0_9BACT|nr:hypothetical protein [Occallatibacter riparius]UWZ87004.1 hypothetical protein MOP44_11575 [Occallatibacter riparius]